MLQHMLYCLRFADSIVIMNKIAVYFSLCYNGNDDMSEDRAIFSGKASFATGLLDFHELWMLMTVAH